MRVDPKKLVRRLTPTATRALEAAVGRAASGAFYEVVPEHLLLALVELAAGDAEALLASQQLDRLAFAARVERVVQGLRTGNGQKPVIAQTLFTWLQDAWLGASVERGATVLRTADLLLTFAEFSSRYTAESFPELEQLPLDSLRQELDTLVAESPEAAEVSALAGPDAAQAATPAGDEALRRFTVSFTRQARAGKIDPIFGRHREIRQVIDILNRRRKNNPMIVGEPGVGKTALVEGLALAIVQGEVPQSLCDVEVVGLDLGALQAGSGVRGEFENRLKAVIKEVKGAATPIILFIDEAHTLIGAGGSQGTGDAANLLKPELARGELRTIAATTWGEYKKYFEKDAALERRFQPVKVDEPSEQDAVVILRGLRETYEAAHGIPIRDEAVVAAARLSHRYISGRQLPDKAVDLLDSAAARVKVELAAKPESVLSLEAEAASLARAEAAMLRDQGDGFAIDAQELEDVRHKLAARQDSLQALLGRWKKERGLVQQQLEARSTTDGDAAGNDVAEQLAQARTSGRLIHEEVDAHAVARVVQSWTGIPAGKMSADDLRPILDLEDRLRARVKGQDHAMTAVAEAVRMAKAGVNDPDQPIGVLLFVGSSGVGKTETAMALADSLYGGERFLTSINMSEFQEKHSVSRLVGSPPGYVGYGEGGVLTEAVRQRPYSVVLLDECEKADLEVMNLFYQVFDKGVLSDGEGRLINFRNTLVILTSNLATDEIVRLYGGAQAPTAEQVASAIRPVLSRHFKPALLARMQVVPFAPMKPEVLRDIADLKLRKLMRRLADTHKLETQVSDGVLDDVVRRCTESETGARNLDHVLKGSLMPQVARGLLERLAAEEPTHRLHLGLAEGQWQVSFE